MVYDPEAKEAGSAGNHPSAGQPEGGSTADTTAKSSAAQSDRNARRREQRAAAKSAKQHQASTGRDLDYSLNDRTTTPDA